MTLSEGDRRFLREVHAGRYAWRADTTLHRYRDAGLVEFHRSTASEEHGVWKLTAKGQAAIA